MIKVNLKRTAAATALLTVMLLSACAGKSPPVDFYTLSGRPVGRRIRRRNPVQ